MRSLRSVFLCVCVFVHLENYHAMETKPRGTVATAVVPLERLVAKIVRRGFQNVCISIIFIVVVLPCQVLGM